MIRPKRGQRFLHKRFLEIDGSTATRKPATHVVTATRRWGPGPEDITVYHCSADRWESGIRTGSWWFSLGKADGSVLEWLKEER